jgi:hypothetical protein
MSSTSTLRPDTVATYTKNTTAFVNAIRSIANDVAKYPTIPSIVIEGLNNLVETEAKEKKAKADYHQLRDLAEAKDTAARQAFGSFMGLLKTAEGLKDQNCPLVAKVGEWSQEHNSKVAKVIFFVIFLFLSYFPQPRAPAKSTKAAPPTAPKRGRSKSIKSPAIIPDTDEDMEQDVIEVSVFVFSHSFS